MTDQKGKGDQSRDLIIAKIEDEPGISYSQLKKSSIMNDGTLRYHLAFLERKGHLISKKVGKKRIYFVTSVNVGKKGKKLNLEQTRILNIIKKNPGMNMDDLLSMTNVNKSGLKYILEKLKKEKLIWEIENGRGIGYEFITKKRLIQEMKFELIEELLFGDIDEETFLQLIKRLERNENIERIQNNQ